VLQNNYKMFLCTAHNYTDTDKSMATYNSDHFQVFLVRAFRHHKLFHSVVSSVARKLVLSFTHVTATCNWKNVNCKVNINWKLQMWKIFLASKAHQKLATNCINTGIIICKKKLSCCTETIRCSISVINAIMHRTTKVVLKCHFAMHL